MKQKFLFSVYKWGAVLAALNAAAVQAQSTGNASSGGDTLFSYQSEFSYTAPSTLWRGQQEMGDMNTTRSSIGFNFHFNTSTNYQYKIGADWTRLGFGLPTGAPCRTRCMRWLLILEIDGISQTSGLSQPASGRH